jgi:hypothetical protein
VRQLQNQRRFQLQNRGECGHFIPALTGVVTMAFGKPQFIEMAKWFGMSMRLNAPDVPAAVLTDSTDPELASLFTHVVPHKPEMGNYMEPKFHLDRSVPLMRAFTSTVIALP